MLGLIAMPSASAASADRMGAMLSLSNLGEWVDVCQDEDGTMVLAVGAQSWELRAKGIWRVRTYFEGEVI